MCPTRIHVADKHLNMFERPGTPTGDADKKVSSFEFQSVTYGPCTQPDAFTFRGVEFCMTPACQHCNIPLCGMFWLLWTVASHCASCDLLMAQGQARMFLDAFALRLVFSLHGRPCRPHRTNMTGRFLTCSGGCSHVTTVHSTCG